MTDLEILKKITGESDEELLSLLLQMSEEKILVMTNRSKIIYPLKPAVREWVIIAYNRLGMEGESSRSEAGISSSFIEIPKDIDAAIKQYRIVRVNGHAYEKVTEESAQYEEESN